MSVIASLNVLLKANGDQFQSVFGRATHSLKAMDSAASVAKRALATIGVGVSFAAITRGALRVTEAFEQADAMSKRIGTSYNTLVTLQRAAEENASSTEVMNASLQRMTKLLGDASFGESGAIKTLNRIGLSAAALKALAPEQQFATIMERINGLAGQEQKATAIQDVFGRSAAEMGNLLGMSSMKMAEFQSKLKDAGKLMSDSQIGEMRNVAESADELTRAWDGFTTKFVASAAPIGIAGLKIAEAALNPSAAISDSMTALERSSKSGALDSFGPNANRAWQEMFTEPADSVFRRSFSEIAKARLPNTTATAEKIAAAASSKLPEFWERFLGLKSASDANASNQMLEGVARRRAARDAMSTARSILNLGSDVGGGLAGIVTGIAGGVGRLTNPSATEFRGAAAGISAGSHADRLFSLNKDVQQESAQPAKQSVQLQKEMVNLLEDISRLLGRQIPVIDL